MEVLDIDGFSIVGSSILFLAEDWRSLADGVEFEGGVARFTKGRNR
jgi:hypothetical protein